MPSLNIIDYVIQSFGLLNGLEEVPIKIVMDGYKVCGENRTKKGRITAEAEILYEEYHSALRERYKSDRFEIIKCPNHVGFAHAVREGLERCNTTYALIAQHDRCFCCEFDRLRDLMDAMDRHEHIRYIGFPTHSNITHDKLLHFNYDLDRLNKSDVKIDLGGNLYLQPLVFWFDSQHICHIQRYLNIFKPYKTFPKDLFDLVGLKAVKDMLLRPGDFIEDRFGQMQRNLLTSLRNQGCSDEILLHLFHWYGSYLCWMSNNEHPYDVQYDTYKTTTRVMVSHLHGRNFDFHKVEEYAQQMGYDKIKSKRFLALLKALEADETFDNNVNASDNVDDEEESQLAEGNCNSFPTISNLEAT
jgi:hypothetical protein